MPTSGATIGPRARHGEGPREETSLLGFVNVLLRYRSLIAVCSLIGGAILGLASLQTNRMFLSYTTFTVRGSRTAQSTSLAARFGLATPLPGETLTPQYYGDLVTSRAVLGPVAQKIYSITTPTGKVERPLAYFFGIDVVISVWVLPSADRLKQVSDDTPIIVLPRAVLSSWGVPIQFD